MDTGNLVIGKLQPEDQHFLVPNAQHVHHLAALDEVKARLISIQGIQRQSTSLDPNLASELKTLADRYSSLQTTIFSLVVKGTLTPATVRRYYINLRPKLPFPIPTLANRYQTLDFFFQQSPARLYSSARLSLARSFIQTNRFEALVLLDHFTRILDVPKSRIGCWYDAVFRFQAATLLYLYVRDRYSDFPPCLVELAKNDDTVISTEMIQDVSQALVPRDEALHELKPIHNFLAVSLAVAFRREDLVKLLIGSLKCPVDGLPFSREEFIQLNIHKVKSLDWLDAPDSEQFSNRWPLFRSPILNASSSHNFDLAYLLYDHGARFWEEDGLISNQHLNNLFASVFTASQSEEGLRFVKWLFEKSLPRPLWDRTSPQALTLIHFAAMNGPHLLPYLHETLGLTLEAKAGPENKSALHLAAIKGQLPAVEYCIEHGISPELVTSKNFNALHIAIIYRQLDILKWLCEKFPELADKPSLLPVGTPFFIAALYSNIPAMEYLYYNMRSKPIHPDYPAGALEIALGHGRVESVKWLVSHDITQIVPLAPNAALGFIEERTWIHIAVSSGCIEIVQWAFSTGRLNLKHSMACELWIRAASMPASFKIKEEVFGPYPEPKDVKTSSNSNTESSNFQEASPTFDLNLTSASSVLLPPPAFIINNAGTAGLNGPKWLMKWMVANGFENPQYCDPRGTSALFYACANGNLELIEYLVCDLGLSPSQHAMGRNALSAALFKKQFEVLRFFHRIGIITGDFHNLVSRQLVAESAAGDHLDVLKWLNEEVGVSLKHCTTAPSAWRTSLRIAKYLSHHGFAPKRTALRVGGALLSHLAHVATPSNQQMAKWMLKQGCSVAAFGLLQQRDACLVLLKRLLGDPHRVNEV